MKHNDPEKDAKSRKAKVSLWSKRLKKLEKQGMSRASFCRKYGLQEAWLSRASNMKPVPLWRKIEEVEKVLDKEEKWRKHHHMPKD